MNKSELEKKKRELDEQLVIFGEYDEQLAMALGKLTATLDFTISILTQLALEGSELAKSALEVLGKDNSKQ